jgi:LmbE family N-acetylglucosaminyl deacetylase
MMIWTSSRDEKNRALVERLRTRPIVVLSPHFDDACLSLGGTLSAVGRGTLVNIFTRGLWLKRSDIDKPTEDHVRSVRDSEDAAFAKHCGLVRHDLRCREPALNGRKPLDVSHVEDDVAQAAAPLMAKLHELAENQKGAFLFSPLGVGRHVNHRATVEIVLRNLAHIRQIYEDVFFYEDQPYAANPHRRWQALNRIRKRLGQTPLARQVYVPEWSSKKTLIGFYPSQFPPPILQILFRPGAMSPLVPHEAFWGTAKDRE